MLRKMRLNALKTLECEVLQIKYSLGYKIRQAYKSKNISALKDTITDIEEVICKVEEFYDAFKSQWFIENKPHGFDVQDIRIGGLIMRLKSCKNRLEEYIDGKINIIDELEEKLIDLTNGTENFEQKIVVLNDWKKNVSVNIL